MANVLQGTWEEIKLHDAELAGRHVKVIWDSQPIAEERPFYETATPEEWAQALYEWGASHTKNDTFLSDEAVERDSIYEGRGE